MTALTAVCRSADMIAFSIIDHIASAVVTMLAAATSAAATSAAAATTSKLLYMYFARTRLAVV